MSQGSKKDHTFSMKSQINTFVQVNKRQGKKRQTEKKKTPKTRETKTPSKL